MTEVVWVGVDVPSRERCLVHEAQDRVVVRGVVEREDGTYDYELHADGGWRFRSLSLTHREESRVLEVARTGTAWTVGGRARPDLAEAVEVDISASPLSNTLPVRRLGLAVGEHRDIVTAYVAVPDLTVVTDPQRYTRIGAHAWLYESRDTDFRRVVTVDDAGLVVSYPGLFERP